MKNPVCLLYFALAIAPAAADEESPYVQQRLPGAAPVRIEAETAVGSRDARPFGERGVEETLRLAFRPLPRLELVLSGSSQKRR